MTVKNINLDQFCEIVKKLEVGTGRPSKGTKECALVWRESAGKLEGGSLFFYTTEKLKSDKKLSLAEKKKTAKETKRRIVSDLIATGAFTEEQLKHQYSSVIDLVVKVHEEIYRLKQEGDKVEEGRAAYLSGSIRFNAMPNIEAMRNFCRMN